VQSDLAADHADGLEVRVVTVAEHDPVDAVHGVLALAEAIELVEPVDHPDIGVYPTGALRGRDGALALSDAVAVV
jgi:hypothetical protein